jgi:glycerol-3-phosphate dehydrogenase
VDVIIRNPQSNDAHKGLGYHWHQPMQRDLTAMEREPFDLLVIGGGIVGAGVARDAALRGLRVALVEKGDFGGGTTAHSTRLIHGGLRYLELYDFGLVRESLQERELLLRLAPHRVRPLLFLVPLYSGQRWKPLQLKAGLTLYDWMADRRPNLFGKTSQTSLGVHLPRHQNLSANDALHLEPNLKREGLTGAMLYYDAQVAFPERLVLDNLLDAAAHGGRVANYARVTGFLREGDRVVGVLIADCLSETTQPPNHLTTQPPTVAVRARCVINATGPWVDEILRLANPNLSPCVRRTKGVHLVVPRFTKRAVLLLAENDGRVFFVIPWNDCSLIGTTDTDFEDAPDRAVADADDVAYLVRETQRAFPRADLSCIFYTFSGVRPLVRKEGVAESRVSRRHQIIDHAADRLPGLFSLVGGKITTYRRFAEEVVDTVCSRLRRLRRGATQHHPFVGNWATLPRRLSELAAQRQLSLSPEHITYLAETYGEQSIVVIEHASRITHHASRITPSHPAIWAELDYAIENEMVCASADFLLRRTTIGFTPDQGRGCVEAVAAFVGQRLGWSEERVRQDVAEYQSALEKMGVPARRA